MTLIEECDNSAALCDNSVITAASRKVSCCNMSEGGVYAALDVVCINADYTT